MTEVTFWHFQDTTKSKDPVTNYPERKNKPGLAERGLLSQPLAVPTILAEAAAMGAKQPSCTSSPRRHHKKQKNWPAEPARIIDL